MAATQITRKQYEEAMKGIGIKCSELITTLSGLISEHGDLPIIIHRKKDKTTTAIMDSLEITIHHDLTIDKASCRFLLKDRF